MIKRWSGIREYEPVATEDTKFCGRRKLFTDETEITENNIEDVLNGLIFDIYDNYRQIKMLKNYERGLQPIISREKKIRGDINNKTVVNHAHEIKEFKKGFLFGEPISCVQRAKNDVQSMQGQTEEQESNTDNGVAELNQLYYEQNKSAKDLKLADELCVTGVGYRMALANDDDSELAPFKIYPLLSEYTFEVFTNDVFQKKILAGTFVIKETGVVKVGAYTDDKYFELEGSNGAWKLTKEPEDNGIGMIPIVGYRYDENLMSSFEYVIRLINAKNKVSSDRTNGVEQFVQAILWLNNIKLTDEDFKSLMIKGCIQSVDISPDKKATVEWLASELNQENTQKVIDDFTDMILEIAGVPSRNQSSGGNTGQAIMLSEGWHIASTQAQTFVEMFKADEQEFNKLILKICQNSTKASENVKGLNISDIMPEFNINRTDNIITKVQALQGLLEAGVHPRIAFRKIELFGDSEQAYLDSKSYLKKWEYEEETQEETHSDEEDVVIDEQTEIVETPNGEE